MVSQSTRRGLAGLPIPLLAWVALASGCGGGVSSSPRSTDQICSSYFQAVVVDCPRTGGIPDAELNRLRPRFVTACVDLLAVPGEGVTAAALDACTAALVKVGGCSNELGVIEECRFPHGTLPAGAPCQDGGQCMSGGCQRVTTTSDAGGGVITEPACGVCSDGVPAAVGQPCPVGTAGCVDGAACTAASPSTCQPIVLSAAGAACDFATSRCKTGSLCDASTLTCVALGAAGFACTSTLECAAGLVCRTTPAIPTFSCQPPAARGEACASTADCGRSLGCSTATLQCAPIAWASAGQPCSDLMPCLIGQCPSTTPAVCPTVLADGQACVAAVTDTTCDGFAACLDGTCQLEGTPHCQ
jgi:hypothetical protein